MNRMSDEGKSILDGLYAALDHTRGDTKGSKTHRVPIGKGTTEADEQAMVCRWLDARGLVYFAVPNGAQLGGRNRFAQMNKLKKTGLKPGVLDLIILDSPDENQAWYATESLAGRAVIPAKGTAVEMKLGPRSRLSDDQVEWVDRFKKRGWAVVVGYGAADAIAKLEELYP